MLVWSPRLTYSTRSSHCHHSVHRRSERLRAAFFQLARGVCRLHDANIIHRDLKPSNVLVTATGRVVVLDFGLARELAPAASGTRPESIAGSPPYMSPEQWSQQPLTTATDWYSVGVMLFEALTGVRPFSGSPQKIIASQQLGAPPISDWVLDIPADLEALCRELLDPNPRARPSGDEVLRRLDRSREFTKPQGIVHVHHQTIRAS
ncbi:serine/threonine-protein kinase [Cystobacter fuscus]